MRGLVPGIVQDVTTGEVLMLGYLDEDALAATLRTGLAHFHSRSRGRLWMKGETSGNTLAVREIRADCDGDTLLVLADPAGPTCHTGARSCFARPNEGANAPGAPAAAPAAAPDGPGTPPPGFAWLDELWATINGRATRRPDGSYTVRLLEGGVDAAARKVVEEATEVLMAAKDDAVARPGDPEGTDRRPPSRPSPDPLAEEMADLLYHLLVLAAERDLPPSAVIEVLRRRHAR